MIIHIESYVVSGDRGTAADKPALLKNAIADYEKLFGKGR